MPDARAPAQLLSLPQLSREDRQGRGRVNSLPWGGSSAWVRWTGITGVCVCGGVRLVRVHNFTGTGESVFGALRGAVAGHPGRMGTEWSLCDPGYMLSDPGRPRR